jgi:hypothetical protein
MRRVIIREQFLRSARGSLFVLDMSQPASQLIALRCSLLHFLYALEEVLVFHGLESVGFSVSGFAGWLSLAAV